MPRERDNEFQTDEFEDLNQNNNSMDDESIVKAKSGERPSKDSKDGKKPWHKRFGVDENLRNRQYSRTSRNQPEREASTLSKVLLGAFVVLLIIPFIVLLIVESQRNNDEIPARTKEQVMISRSSISSQSEESSSVSISSQVSISSGQGTNGQINVASSDESIGSQQINAPAPTPAQAPAPTPAQAPTPTAEAEPTPAPAAGSTHTVNAGETWYGIARTYGINVYDLLAANGANEGTPIHPGDVVVVP